MIAVTGVRGALGSRVVPLLEAADAELRLVVRSTPGAPSGDHEVRTAPDYADRDGMTAALTGCDTLFLVSGREAPDRVAAHRSAVAAARAAGVERVVYTSFQGAAPDCTFTFGRDHWHTEQAVRETGMAYVFLRDSLYLSGLTGMAGADDMIRGPAGDGTVAAVSQDDVASVAAALLTGTDRWGETLDVTGPASISLAEAAAVMSAWSGREIRYEAETEPQAYASRAVYDAPAFAVAGWVSSYLAIAAGELSQSSDTVPTVTGRPAQDLAGFLDANPDALDHVRR